MAGVGGCGGEGQRVAQSKEVGWPWRDLERGKSFHPKEVKENK